MNSTGEQLIDNCCKKLKQDSKLCTDIAILNLLRSLDNYELNQLIVFGTIDKWERERKSLLKTRFDSYFVKGPIYTKQKQTNDDDSK